MGTESTNAAVMDKPDCCTSALRHSHGELRDRLTQLAEGALDELSERGGPGDARDTLVRFVTTAIVPLSTAEEALASESPTADPLVNTMPGRRRMIEVLAGEIQSGGDVVTVAAAIGALVMLCDARWQTCDDALIPTLVDAGIDLEPLVR